MHSKHSPLAEVSEEFIRGHINPYIDVFEELAASPNARGLPELPNWPEVVDEINVATQRVYLLEATPQQALRDAQTRAQAKIDRFFARQEARKTRTDP
jgi:hypothetical protein